MFGRHSDLDEMAKFKSKIRKEDGAKKADDKSKKDDSKKDAESTKQESQQ